MTRVRRSTKGEEEKLLRDVAAALRDADRLLEGTGGVGSVGERGRRGGGAGGGRGGKAQTPGIKTSSAVGGFSRAAEKEASLEEWESTMADLYESPRGPGWRAAMRREGKRLRKPDGSIAPSGVPMSSDKFAVWTAGGVAPRPSRSLFVASTASGGQVHTCRHVPPRGTVARKRGDSGLPPLGSSDPMAPGMRDAKFAGDEATHVAPLWNDVEVQVAKRRFLTYADYLQARDRGEEGIPLWAV